jgi:predicted permease
MSSFYRRLLRLYPSSFRAEYEPELVRAFEESTRGEGPLAKTIAAVSDVVPNAAAAHASILRQDLRYALRSMRHSRGFVVTAVLITALGVGANTATFSIADFVLLRPLPFPDPRSIVRLCEGPKEGGGWGCMNELSPANFRDVAAATKYTRGWGAYTYADGNLVGLGEPTRVAGVAVGPQVFSTLGVRPLMGTTIDRAEEGSVVLSYGLWQSQFGGDDAIVGKTIRFDGTPRRIAGVMPKGFYFPDRGAKLWVPLVLRDADYEDRNNTYLQAIGRLAPGATFEQGRAEISLVFDRLARDFPATNAETGFSFFSQRDQMLPRNRTILLALCGASLSLLLLTGANLANLLLVRATARERELAVRAALGAGRDRLVRQMLTEGLLLAILGGAAGLLVALLALPILAYLVPSSLPIDAQPGLDGHALAIALAFTTVIGIGFGLIPATAIGRRNGFTALRDGRGSSGARQRIRAALVSVEVAVSVVLLVSSAFLIRALWKVQAVDPGFSAQGVLLMRTVMTQERSSDSVRRQQFYDQVLAGVKALPGVEWAAYTSGVPMVLTGGVTDIAITGAERPTDRRRNPVSYRIVTPEFFRTLRIPIVRGRAFDATDRLGRPLVAVVSESFAERYWPNEEPIGKTFSTRGQAFAVVGIVPDIHVRGLERTSEPQLYTAAAQGGSQLGGLQVPKDLIIRAGDRALSLAPAAREVIRRVDPDQPVSDVSLLSNVIERQTADRRAQLRVLGALAAVALLLTAIGIHGLLAFMVAQRSREIGVRLALGAEPGRVARMIVGEAARLGLIGALPGGFAAYAAAKATQSLLFGIQPSDPLTLAGGVLVVMLVTFVGSVAPAWRAVRVSPLEAIRAE